MNEEIGGIKPLIVDLIAKNKKMGVEQIAAELFLKEDTVLEAVQLLIDDGVVFQPSPDQFCLV